CHRRIFQDVLRVITHEALQFLLFAIDALQHRSGGEEFERAAHRKSLLRPIIDMFAATCIQRGDTDSTAKSTFDGCDLIYRVPWRARGGRSEQKNENGYHLWYAGWPSFNATKNTRHAAPTLLAAGHITHDSGSM